MIYQFSDCRLDTEAFELTNAAGKVSVEPQAFSLLQFLIENNDRVVSKDELIKTVWDGRIVSDAALNSCVNAARRAVGDDGKAQSIIRTFPRRGFRFVAEMVGEAIAGEPSANLQKAPSLPDRPSIAVLPFDNLSRDPEQEYFADGITEDIIAGLSRVRQFLVIARNSTFTYKGQAIDVRTVASDLGARYVLEGNVRKAGDRVRVSAQLIDAESRNQIWAENYDRDLKDIFAIQDEITQMVVAAIEPEITKAEQDRVKIRRPESMTAWDHYVQGLQHMYLRDGDEFQKAKQLFKEAIRIDPGFAQAYSGLAMVETFENIITVPTAQDMPEISIQTARKAIDLDNKDATPHAVIGLTYMFQRKYAAAAEEGQIAIDLNPSFAFGYFVRGFGRLCLGEIEEGIESFNIAIRLSPKDHWMGIFLARKADGYIALEDYEKAVVWGRKAILTPHPQIFIFMPLLSALGHLDRTEEAQEVIAELMDIRPDASVRLVRERYPGGASTYIENYLDGLRRAGLPEE